MADRQKSVRTKLRLCLNVAIHIAEDMKRRRMEESSKSDSSGAKMDVLMASPRTSPEEPEGLHGLPAFANDSDVEARYRSEEESAAATKGSYRPNTQ